MSKILLVEDDQRLTSLVQSFLQQHGFTVQICDNGLRAEQACKEFSPELVVLDLMLPGMDGFAVCRALRGWYKQPILMLTAKQSDIDQVLGLELGADDYVIKPVEPRVLLARIHALLRRTQGATTTDQQRLEFGKLKLNQSAREAYYDGQLVELTSYEFDLLWMLAKHAGQTVRREAIHKQIIGREYDGLDRTVDVRVSHLRRKLGDNAETPFRIKTVWGKGYLFVADAGTDDAPAVPAILSVYPAGIIGHWLVSRKIVGTKSKPRVTWLGRAIGPELAYQLTTPDLSAEQIASQLNLPLQQLPQHSIGWSDAEQQALDRGQLVPLFSDNQVYFYQVYQDQLLQFGPVQVEVPAHNTYLFTLLFFLLLGVALAGFLWPVARDIETLQRQLRQFGQGMQLPDPPLPESSLLTPIARSVRQMANQIIRLMSLQREMTHAVSHELRTPLARLKFALELQPLADTEKHAMQQDLAELDQLVDEMLDYARLEAQTVRLTFEEVDLVELLENLLEKLAPLPGAPILLQRPARLRWICDGHYLERALQNLLLNAKRYARQQVMLTVQLQGPRLLLTVDDDGPGVPSDQREAIMQPFVRVDQSRNRDKGGFGLGLAIVSRIVGWHQGRLWIEDSLLGGARFNLLLPPEPAGHKNKTAA